MKRLLFTWPVFVIGLTVGLLGLVFVPEPEYNETPLDDVSYVITAPVQSTTTTTVLPANGDCEALGAFAVSLGWPVTEIETLKKVSYRESRCWHDVINTRDVNGGRRRKRGQLWKYADQWVLVFAKQILATGLFAGSRNCYNLHRSVTPQS